MENSSTVVGVDIGGSHITAALVDLRTRSVLPASLFRELINADGSVDEIISNWSSVINSACNHDNNNIRVGIAMPGPFEYEAGISLIKNQNKYEALYGLNVKKLLGESLDINESDIFLMNDAACFLQGEAFGGAAKGFKKAMGLTLGTGLGSARFYNNVAEDADLWQSPFLDGIAEDYLSTRWFVKRFFELTGITLQNVKELVELKTNRVDVKKIFDEFGKNLALFLSDFILNEKPEVVVFGGSIANAYQMFFPVLSTSLAKNSHTFFLKKAMLGEHGNLIGAASCWYKNVVSIN